MMKRLYLIILCVCFLLTGCAGGTNNGVAASELTFYYMVDWSEGTLGDSAVDSEQRTMEIYTLQQLVEAYLSGPISEHLTSPFPAGTRLISVDDGENGMELTMSGEFFTLQGVDLTIATCCLVRTVCDYVQIDQITLVDEMDRIRLELRPDDFLLKNSFESQSDSIYTLYFADENYRYLIAETREVTLSENESPETYLIRQLMLGPDTSGLNATIPQGTELLWTKTEGETCTVNFSSHFLSESGKEEYRDYTTIWSIVNTLTGLESVSSVQFLVEGKVAENFGLFPISQPIYRHGGAIGPIRANGTEVDVNIYVLREDGKAWFALPSRVKLTISQPLAEAVAQAVIDHESGNGFYNPIPYGTELLSISVSGSTCYLDLSKEFIPSDGTRASEQAAVWALVTSLTDLGDISSVALSIEGENSGLQYVDITEPLTADMVDLG